jgi:class 3 adenylate cyclase
MVDALKILVVDDNETNRTVLHDLIVSIGHVPVMAENGLSALAQIRGGDPDMVLLDLLMPEMDGYGVLQQLKDRGLLRGIPVVVVSSVDDMDSIVRCIEIGADDYLIKPFNHTLLKARISACLEKKRLRDRDEEFRTLVEDYNLNLEAKVREQVKRITAVELERANLGRYLSPSIVDSVLKSGEAVDLGGRKATVTVVFTDIRGYTRLSQELETDEIMNLLNEHFTAISRIVFDHEGTLDKFIGDSVMAVFGSPFSSGQDAVNAVLAAQDMQRAVHRWTGEPGREQRHTFQIGIGINTGTVIAGNIGSPEKMDFTVIGDTVNLSSRLQGIAKGGEIIVGEPTYEIVRERFPFEEVGEVALKNSIRPVRCYRLMFE